MLLISPATLWPLEDRTMPSSGSLPNMWHMTWPMVLLIKSEQPSSCHSTHLLCGRHLAFFLFYEYRKLILAAEPFHLWFPLLGIPHSRSSRGQLFVILASAHVQPLTEAFPDTHIKIIPYHFYQSYISVILSHFFRAIICIWKCSLSILQLCAYDLSSPTGLQFPWG